MLLLVCKRTTTLIVDLGALDTTSLAITSRSLLLCIAFCWRRKILVESGGFLGFNRLTNDGILILGLANRIKYLLLWVFFIPLLKLYFCIRRSLCWFRLLFSILFALNVHILRIVHVYFVELLLMLLKTAIRTLEIVIKVVILLLLLVLLFTGIWLFWIY